MRTEGFNGILLSILMTASLIAPAITTISLLSVSPVSANPGDSYENIVRAGDTAYNLDGDAYPFWRLFGPDEADNRPVIMAANTIGSGKVVAAGFGASCRNGRWNSPSNPYPNLDDLLDAAFRWMTGLQPNQMDVLWYGDAIEEYDYHCYNHVARCFQLTDALKAKGYTVDNTNDGAHTEIDETLLSGVEILVIPQMELGPVGEGGDPTQLPQSVVDNIENFVRGGGGLLIMEGYDSFGYNYCEVQNKILHPLELNMGIYFQSDYITDEEDKLWYTHSITADVDTGTTIGTTYQTLALTNKIGFYITSSLAERDNYEVSAKISPGYQSAFPNRTVEFDVSAIAMGWNRDNLDLSVDNVWPATLDNYTFENVGPKGKATKLKVTIPGDALGTEDEITVTVTSKGDNKKSMEFKRKAIASMRIGPALEDTYVTRWVQEYGQVLGTYIWMQVGSDSENNKRTYLKFDLSALNPEKVPPAGTRTIDDIHARLFAYCEVIPTYAAAGKNVQCRKVDNDDWHENEMWWGENEPAFGDNLYTTAVTQEDYWYSWDVTSYVIQEYKTDPDNIASFCLKAETENLSGTGAFEYYSFASSNATEPDLHPYLMIGYDVSTWTSPDYDGLPGGTLTYTVNVWNRGSETDNFNLSKENVWETTLSPTTIPNVEPMGIGTATLTVKIPDGAAVGDNDTILITATSDGYSGENDIGTCIARASSTHVSSWEDSSTRGRDDQPHTLENHLWGRNTTIYVGRYNDAHERGWLKFDLRAFPAGTTITRANLNLHCYSTYGADVRVYGVGDDSWSESTINWLNKPSIADENALDTRAVIENDKWYSWDVTDFVLNENAGDKVVSFCLVDIGETLAPDHDARFSSKEYEENWPYLEILAAAPNTDVRALAKPIFQGGVGTTLTYTITVVNKGNSLDSFNLTVAENKAWGSYLSENNLPNIASGENSTTMLNVPVSGAVCTTNEITITVTSTENAAIYDKIVCSAHRSGVTLRDRWLDPGNLRSLYEVWLDLNVLLRDDASDLVLEFYDRSDVFQDDNVVWSTMPAHLENLWKNPHPEGNVGVEIIRLVLKDGGDTIQTLYTFSATKVTYETRFLDLPSEWAGADAAGKVALETEFLDIPFYWSGAP